MSGALVDLLLRDRRAAIAKVRDASPADVAAIARVMVATIAVCAAIVGAVLGSYRGGAQIAFAAIKLPIVLLGAAVLSAPVLTAVTAALGKPPRLVNDLVVVITALAFGALVLVAGTPLLMLARAGDVGYHATILLVVAVFAIAGLACLRVVIGGAAPAPAADPTAAAPGRTAAVLALCTVFAVVGGQLAWALRPYLVRPASRNDDVTFVHPLEGSLIDAVVGTARSTQRGW
jgi:hypothetical protein